MAANEYAARLNEAMSARHQLLTGKSVVEVTRNGTGVKYSKANLFELNAYIEELQYKVNGSGKRRPPAGLIG